MITEQWLQNSDCIKSLFRVHALGLYIYIFPKQCLHLRVLTLALTNWPCATPPGFRHRPTPIANSYKNTRFYKVFCNMSSKTKENPGFFNIFSKISPKTLIFQCFLQSELKNQGKPMLFQHFQQNIAKTTCFVWFFAIWAQIPIANSYSQLL